MAAQGAFADAPDQGWRRFLVPVLGVIGIVVVAIGLAFLADPKAGQNLLANIYDALGNTSGADALRNGQGDQFVAKLIIAAVALTVGVGGVWMVYTGVSAIVGLLRPRLQARIIPWVFVLPALALLGIYLVWSTIDTIWESIVGDQGFSDNYGSLLTPNLRATLATFVISTIVLIGGALIVGLILGRLVRRTQWAGLARWATYLPPAIAVIWSAYVLFMAGLTPDFRSTIGNNLLWLVVATGGSVLLGLVIAGLFDRVRREALAKTFIFLPLAISLVGASVIWRFVYTWRPPGQPQYGLLNAVWTAFGQQPVNWIATPSFGIDTYALIVIMIWLQTGFAMVVLSAAIKGVSVEVIEAARLDGASERQLFFGVIVPIIRGSIIAVATTIAIAVLKIFDIVFVMTGGRYGTDVVANQMFIDKFQFFQDGRAAALAVVLFIAVLPIMFVNLRNLRQQGVGA